MQRPNMDNKVAQGTNILNKSQICITLNSMAQDTDNLNKMNMKMKYRCFRPLSSEQYQLLNTRLWVYPHWTAVALQRVGQSKFLWQIKCIYQECIPVIKSDSTMWNMYMLESI